jgi:predicted nucleic acid-binding protein
MNLIDSSGWLEYFVDGPNAKHFLTPLKDSDSLVVPVVVIYEVFKVVLRERGENEALQALAAMQKGKTIDITPSLAIAASRISLKQRLPMADSMILAAAETSGAVIWTQDSHFKDLPGVKYFPKK